MRQLRSANDYSVAYEYVDEAETVSPADRPARAGEIRGPSG